MSEPRTCHDCGSTAAETRFQFARKPTSGPPDRCCDCAAEAARLPLFPLPTPSPP